MDMRVGKAQVGSGWRGLWWDGEWMVADFSLNPYRNYMR